MLLLPGNVPRESHNSETLPAGKDIGPEVEDMIKMTNEREIPFEVSIDPFYSESNMKHLRSGIKALDQGEGVEHDLIEEDG